MDVIALINLCCEKSSLGSSIHDVNTWLKCLQRWIPSMKLQVKCYDVLSC